MAEVPVRRDRPAERSLFSRSEDNPRFGLRSRWEEFSPWSLMRRFTDDMDRMFGGSHEGSAFWSPSIDVRERDNNLIISADLPGLSKDDVKVEMTNDGLLIQGERKHEHEDKREGYYRSERSYGAFSRLIPLPEGVNAEQAKAQFRDGVLEITIPAPQSVRNRREIPIETTAGGVMLSGGTAKPGESSPKTRTSGGGA